MLKKTGSESWNLLRTSYKRLFIELMKIKLIAAAIVILALLIGAGIGFGLSYLPDIAIIPAVVIIGIILIIAIFLSAVAASVGYNVVDSVSKRREFSFKSNFKKNMWPLLRYSLLIIGIYLLIFIPLTAVSIILVGGAYVVIPPPINVLIGMLSQMFSRIIISVVGAIVYLFLQFAIFELIVGRRGAVDSIKKSIKMVKKRPLETIIFSFALWAVNVAISIPLFVILMFLFLIGVAVAIGVLAMDASLLWLLIALAIVPLILIMFVFSVIMTSVMYSAQYTFWNRIKVQ